MIVMLAMAFMPMAGFAATGEEGNPLPTNGIDKAVGITPGTEVTPSENERTGDYYWYSYTPAKDGTYAFSYEPRKKGDNTEFFVDGFIKESDEYIQLSLYDRAVYSVNEVVFRLKGNKTYYFRFEVFLPDESDVTESEPGEMVGFMLINAQSIDANENFAGKLKGEFYSLLAFTPEEDAVYAFKHNGDNEYPFYPEILYFDGENREDPSTTIACYTDEQGQNKYIYHLDNLTDGALKLSKNQTYYFFLKTGKETISSCMLEKVESFDITYSAETGGKVVGNPWNDNEKPSSTLVQTQIENGFLSCYILVDEGYEIEGLYRGNTLLESSVTHLKDYVFVYSVGGEERHYHTSWTDGKLYVDENESILELMDKNFVGTADKEGWIAFDLEDFQKALNAKSYTLEREYYSVNAVNDDKIDPDQNVPVIVKFKRIETPSGGGGGTVLPPIDDQKENQKTETVTKPDGSTVIITTEKDVNAGTETKTEVTKNTGGSVSANTETNVEVKPETAENKGSAVIDQTAAEKVVEKIKQAEKQAKAAGATDITSTVTFELKTSVLSAAFQLELPSAVVNQLLKETNAELKVVTPLGTVQFDQKSMEKIEKTAVSSEGNLKITISETEKSQLPDKVKAVIGDSATVLNFNLMAGEKKVRSFDGGKAEIIVDIPKKIAANILKAIYVKTNGFAEAVAGELVKIDGKEKYRIKTGHFSYYVLVDTETADRAIQATAKEITKGVRGTKIISVTKKCIKGKIKLSWKKTSGYKLDGYEVFKSTKKNSAYKKMITKTTTSYVNTKGLKKGKTYWYKIRGYRVIDGKKVYTGWTKVQATVK